VKLDSPVLEKQLTLNSTIGRYRIQLEEQDSAQLVFRTMRSRDHDVVLVRRTVDLRCWEFGMEGNGEGMGRGRSVYK
jgi:hypothetical protein